MHDVPSIAAALESGTITEAEALHHLQPFLQKTPLHAQAFTLAGFCHLRRGDPTEAIAMLNQALNAQPNLWLARLNRAEAHRQAGNFVAAAADYRQAVQENPQPELFINLATVLDQLDDQPGADQALEAALQLDPHAAAALNNLGLRREKAGRAEEALALFERAAAAAPENEAILENLERLLFEKGRRLEGEEKAGTETARHFYEEQIARYPRIGGLFLAFGTYWLDRGEIERAQEAFGKLLALHPENPVALINYGVALNRLGRPAEALAYYEAAAKKEGTPSPRLRWNRAFSLLSLGRLKEGFTDYETRDEYGIHRRLEGSRWNGEPFPGKTLLLHAEQGLGDTIQFIRYAALAKQLSPTGTVVIACDPPLTRLLRRAHGIDRVVAFPVPPQNYDWHVPLLSLPHIFKTELNTIPAEIPTFTFPGFPAVGAPASPSTPFRIALTWSGNPKYKNDRRRSCPLSLFAPLGALPDTRWVSLQHGPAAGEVAHHDWLKDGSAGLSNLEETAFRLAEVDLVITVDTALAHLAGALGRPTWILLPFASDWRWLQERTDSPWYPTVRLFRQPKEGDWKAVIEAVATALSELKKS